MSPDAGVEYYYGDVLRWSFGFDNPNKAAVVFACALPLCWWLWEMSWRIRNRWLCMAALLISAGALGVAWYCLIMTFSRGGLVAAAVALAYLIVQTKSKESLRAGGERRMASRWFSAALLAILLSGAVGNGFAGRATDSLGGDASVGNRLELWKGALQMAAENPAGFGHGQSGSQYMQWYQPLDREQGYRTMVNSFLTFLVERGWWWSLGVVVAVVVFIVWTRPLEGEHLVTALRATILAFMVAGVFSTTMEEWRLWILPGVAVLVLAVYVVRKRRGIQPRALGATAAIAFTGCAALWGLGIALSHADPLTREFDQNGFDGMLTSIAPRQGCSGEIGCMVDELIVGDRYARLLRELALGAGVRVFPNRVPEEADCVLLMGSGVHSWSEYRPDRLLLLAPEVISQDEIAALGAAGCPVSVILPGIDEDGRVGFWEDVVESDAEGRFEASTLEGVGNRVDWAWGEVIGVAGGKVVR